MTVETPAPTGRKRRRGVVTPYDFRRPTTLAREHTRALEMAFETFARQWSTLLLTRLRQTSQVTLTGVSARSYDEYVRSLPGYGAFFTFRPDAGGPAGLFQLSAETAFASLDFLLGGHGSVVTTEEREPTEIERRLFGDLITRTLAELAYAFATTAPMKPVPGTLETSAQFLQLAAAADVVLVATFSITLVEEGEPSEATMMLPMGPLMARLHQASGDAAGSEDEQRVRAEAAQTLGTTVPELPVDVSARMIPVVMRPSDVLALEVGDVVRIPHPTARPLDVVTHDIVLARAVAGASGNRLACLVVSPDEENDR
ncbi:flagellar motor switch protein FliM [Quadrisphaera granulorum]|nr:flagellar motor switch protein FliM [Quadrisphaera granulorum]